MANWFYRVLNNNELSPITELQRGGDERRGRRRGGAQWNRQMQMERRGGGGVEGGRFRAAVSLLLRVEILMRTVNECWQDGNVALQKNSRSAPKRQQH